jgi:hypothetical protein
LASDAATVAAPPFDFGAHDRTTRVSTSPDQPTSEAATDVESSPLGAEQPTTGLIAPMTVDVPLRLTRDATDEDRRPPVAPTIAPVSDDRAIIPSTTNVRRKMLAGFGLAGFVVVASTIGAVRLARDRHERSTPQPPSWTRATPDVAPAPISPAPAASPLSTAAARPTPAPAAAAAAAAEPSTAANPTNSHRRRKRPALQPESSIQYGADGMPIIP